MTAGDVDEPDTFEVVLDEVEDVDWKRGCTREGTLTDRGTDRLTERAAQLAFEVTRFDIILAVVIGCERRNRRAGYLIKLERVRSGVARVSKCN